MECPIMRRCMCCIGRYDLSTEERVFLMLGISDENRKRFMKRVQSNPETAALFQLAKRLVRLEMCAL